MSKEIDVERVQTGVRIEKRIVKVLKSLAETSQAEKAAAAAMA